MFSALSLKQTISTFLSRASIPDGHKSNGSELKAASPPTCVSDVMSNNVVSLSRQQTFREAVGLMANRPFRHLLVLSEDGQLAGVISDRDLLRVLACNPDLDAIIVGDVMTSHPVTVQPATPLSSAVKEMLTRRINCLPVVDGETKVCGIVTSTDLLRAFQMLQLSLERVIR